MLTLTIDSNMDEIVRALDDVERRQVPQALAWALNDMAKEVHSKIPALMQKNFDRPTAYARNAFMVWFANKQTLAAEVRLKPVQAGKHYLKVEETGGPRPLTGVEKNFVARAPFAGVIAAVIPATGSAFDAAKLDAFGNWSTGERNQVMSQLRVGRDVGYNSNATEASTRRRLRRGGATYFIPEKGLAPGVYRRKKEGDVPVRVLKFARKTPVYRKRFGFLEDAEKQVRADFASYFARAFEKAMATAR